MPVIFKLLNTLLPFLSGIVLACSFAPINAGYLAPVALASLFWSWQNLSPWQAARKTYIFGLALFGLGVSWVYISVHDFGGADPLGSSLLTAFFVMVWALFPAFIAYCYTLIKTTSQSIWTIVLLPAIWILFEYLRGELILNGFPWLQIAYSQTDTLLAGYIPILGIYGTGFLLALIATTLVYALQHINKRLQMLTLITVIYGLGAYLNTVNWTQAVGPAFKVSLVQGNIAQDQKWAPENTLSTLRLYTELTQQHWDSKVIIWPESSIPANLHQVDEFYVTPMENAAKQHGVDLIVSLPIREDDAFYNAVLGLGKQRQIYKKRHLLPFGEYLPLQPLSGWVLHALGIKLGSFTPGDEKQVFLSGGGYAFSTSICYEDAFGAEVINRLDEVAYLVNATNDAWFGNSFEPHQHMQIARMRALETGRYLLRVTNTGLTGIVNPKGEIVSQAPLFETTVLTGELVPMGGLTPYAKMGNNGILWLLILIICFSLVLRIRAGQQN